MDSPGHPVATPCSSPQSETWKRWGFTLWWRKLERFFQKVTGRLWSGLILIMVETLVAGGGYLSGRGRLSWRNSKASLSNSNSRLVLLYQQNQKTLVDWRWLGYFRGMPGMPCFAGILLYKYTHLLVDWWSSWEFPAWKSGIWYGFDSKCDVWNWKKYFHMIYHTFLLLPGTPNIHL